MDGKTNRELRGEERDDDLDLCQSCEEAYPRKEMSRDDDDEWICDSCLALLAQEVARKNDPSPARFPGFSISVQIVNYGSLKGLAAIKLGEMEIRGFKVIETPAGGRFVAPPSREFKKEGGQPKYHDLVKFDTKESQEEFRRMVLDAYDEELKTDANTT